MTTFNDGQPVSSSKYSCLVVQDILNFNPCLIDQICVPEEKLLNSLSTALDMVGAILGRNLCLEEKCLYVNGKGHDTIYLTEKIHELTSVEFICDNGECQPVATLPRIASSNVLSYDCCEYKFPCGIDNIKVCGVFGETINNAIKDIVIQLALEEAQPGITGLVKYSSVKSISWGDVSISYSNLERVTGMSTGYFELDNKLELFIDAGNSIHYDVTGSCSNCKDNCGCEPTGNSPCQKC